MQETGSQSYRETVGAMEKTKKRREIVMEAGEIKLAEKPFGHSRTCSKAPRLKH